MKNSYVDYLQTVHASSLDNYLCRLEIIHVYIMWSMPFSALNNGQIGQYLH